MKCDKCAGTGLAFKHGTYNSAITCSKCNGYGTLKYKIKPIRRTNRAPLDFTIIGWRITTPEGWLIKMEPTFELAVVWMDFHAIVSNGNMEIA